MCMAAGECLQGWAAKLLLVRWQSWYCTEFLTPNGPVVWGVAVCVRVDMCFCKVPVSGRALAGHDETVETVPSPDRWTKVVWSR
jgi:hypothetical protein